MILLCINCVIIPILIGMEWTQKEGLEVYLSCELMNLSRLQIFNLVHIGLLCLVIMLIWGLIVWLFICMSRVV
ncbi:hypothetical protein NC653_027462 [Populus alba x Populus x berolinensis]|uniref:Uncharacterized protein n=1 Tax=Populus alba x Populus x berolinensis TaxID=444605 RepID=A0AAD6M5I6_9ROSI|nr:hypothetical protein NC653_027462 [Populus alba x Populus x berolinensis]